MSKYEEALKNLSYDVHRLCKEMGWEMDSKDIEVMKELIKENKEVKSQLSLTEKALELACERVKYFEQMQDREMGVVEFFGQEIDYDLQSIIEQYKEQAEEMMKDGLGN